MKSQLSHIFVCSAVPTNCVPPFRREKASCVFSWGEAEHICIDECCHVGGDGESKGHCKGSTGPQLQLGGAKPPQWGKKLPKEAERDYTEFAATKWAEN